MREQTENITFPHPSDASGKKLHAIFYCRPPMRTGSSVVLIALAVFDNLALLLGLPDHLLAVAYGIVVDTWSEFACKSYGYVRAIVDYVGGYLVVVFTIFRVISVYLPHKNSVYCTRRRAYIAVMATICIISIIHLDYVINVQYYPMYEENVFLFMNCWYVGTGLKIFVDYYQYFLLCIRSVIPFTILIVSNSMIIFKINKFKAKRKAMTTSHGNYGSAEDSDSMTPMLISISILFLITQTPYLITNNIIYRMNVDDHSEDYMAKIYLFDTFCRFLTFVNNVANFFCYCISGKKFKSELVTMVKGWFNCYRNQTRNSSVTISTVV